MVPCSVAELGNSVVLTCIFCYFFQNSRFAFNANVSDHDLGTTFLPAFRSCVKAGADGVMCSYNAINGVPACANKMLLSKCCAFTAIAFQFTILY